jgi:hypothetical protein
MKGAPRPTHGRPELDSRDDGSSHAANVGEHGDTRAVGQQLLAPRLQLREPPTVLEQHEPDPASAELLGHVAAIDETELEESLRATAPDAEPAGNEAPHDLSPNPQVDDYADAQAHSNMLHAERSRRQKHERRVISGRRPRRRSRANVENGLRARAKPDPPGPHPEPAGKAAGRAHLRLAVQRPPESGPRDIDEERPGTWVPHRDRRRGCAAKRQPQRACAEADPAAGRGTWDGCRGRTEDQRKERASHLPITVNVSVAV